MFSNRRIARVILAADLCTQMGNCEIVCPEVFEVLDRAVRLRDTADEHLVSTREAIEEAADGCAFQVIQITYTDGSRHPMQ